MQQFMKFAKLTETCKWYVLRLFLKCLCEFQHNIRSTTSWNRFILWLEKFIQPSTGSWESLVLVRGRNPVPTPINSRVVVRFPSIIITNDERGYPRNPCLSMTCFHIFICLHWMRIKVSILKPEIRID